MLEFLQPLVDLIAKALPALAKRRERDEAAKLGAELFLLYVQCNEALIQGERIVLALESYLVRRDGRRNFQTGLLSMVQEQSRNLGGVAGRLRDFQFEFHVLGGDSYRELLLLTDQKANVLQALTGVIEQQQLPLRSTGLFIDGGVLTPGVERSIAQRVNLRHQLAAELAASALPLDRPWDQDTPAVIEHYLAIRKPREELERIRVSLEKIRTALLANFTLGDILLRAGDPRAHRSRR
ncbi:hypothetical protein [Kutzneria chonburiensis]|uniref:GGDEF domain-containing protein n=1 Tax=Kutzneria chonburiensis TaxID=1483604 RepID=A0ABV6N3B5_9PSEU|nr:hypothetical protein [Kutzneria chonburiensis]